MGFVTYEWKNTKTKNKTVLSARCFKSFFFMVGPENCFKIKWLRWVFTPDVRLSLAKLSRLGHHALCRCSNSYQRVWQYHLFPKRMVQVNIHNGTERPIHRCFITPPSPPGLPPGCSASPQSLHWLNWFFDFLLPAHVLDSANKHSLRLLSFLIFSAHVLDSAKDVFWSFTGPAGDRKAREMTACPPHLKRNVHFLRKCCFLIQHCYFQRVPAWCCQRRMPLAAHVGPHTRDVVFFFLFCSLQFRVALPAPPRGNFVNRW